MLEANVSRVRRVREAMSAERGRPQARASKNTQGAQAAGDGIRAFDPPCGLPPAALAFRHQTDISYSCTACIPYTEVMVLTSKYHTWVYTATRIIVH